MDTFKDFRRWLVTGLIAVVVSVGGYLYTAQAATLVTLANDVRTHAERIAKLESLLESQREINRELKEIVLYLSRK
jgi:hypothetical protein